MNSQEKIAWLKRYRGINGRINRLIEEKDRWWGLATKRTQTLSGMPHGGDSEDKTQVAVEKIIETEHEIDAEIDSLVKTRAEIESAIGSLSDEVLKELMEHRYIDDEKWEEIAVEMHYDYRYVLKLHGKALILLQIDE